MQVSAVKAIKQGATRFVDSVRKYSALHEQLGITEPQWNAFTGPDIWTAEQARDAGHIIKQLLEGSCAIAGLAPEQLPGQCAVMLIARAVDPINLMVACKSAPESWDALPASGALGGIAEAKPMHYKQMVALAIMYQGEYQAEIAATMKRK